MKMLRVLEKARYGGQNPKFGQMDCVKIVFIPLPIGRKPKRNQSHLNNTHPFLGVLFAIIKLSRFFSIVYIA